ncbi:MAG TPA: hypothetical protein VHS03_04515 [Gaiellaceae bacterium]|nr:hypothetical protein [Gaiellaceae bacterium]
MNDDERPVPVGLDGDAHETMRVLTRQSMAHEHGLLIEHDSLGNYHRATVLAHSILDDGCEHCDLMVSIVPAVAGRLVVDVIHEHGCPRNDDDDVITYPPTWGDE